MGKLYVIATPIGNLEDITLRALRILKEVDIVFCEDTRVTRKLLDHYKIKKSFERYDEHSHIQALRKISSYLEAEKNVALVTDAGTPNISDPGSRLIISLREQFPDIAIIPVPGASAIAAALSVSGISGNTFFFAGYPPHKKGRKKFFENLTCITAEDAVVLYESPFRILNTLRMIEEYRGASAHICIARELTKVYEDIRYGEVKTIREYFEAHPEKRKGEFVVVIQSK